MFEDAPKLNRFKEIDKPSKEKSAFKIFSIRGVDTALARIKEAYEKAADEKNCLPFHNQSHTNAVIRRAEFILRAMKDGGTPVSMHDFDLLRLSAAFHDVIQNWQEERISEGDFTKIRRKRFIGDNEKDSIKTAHEFMENANQENKSGVFSEQDKAVLQEAIEATVPGFNPKLGVTQPNLKKESHPITRALALADLGTAGMNGPEKFLKEGDLLFKEENLDILEALKNPSALSDKQKGYFKKRILAWVKFQETFARGRKELLEKEVEGLPETAKEKIRQLFNKFDESIKAAEENSQKRQNMTFEELARDLGYKV